MKIIISHSILCLVMYFQGLVPPLRNSAQKIIGGICISCHISVDWSLSQEIWVWWPFLYFANETSTNNSCTIFIFSIFAFGNVQTSVRSGIGACWGISGGNFLFGVCLRRHDLRLFLCALGLLMRHFPGKELNVQKNWFRAVDKEVESLWRH